MTNQELIDKWNELTAANNHGEALQTLAHYLNMSKHENILQHINAICDIEGHLPAGLHVYRETIRVELFNVARIVLGEEFRRLN